MAETPTEEVTLAELMQMMLDGRQVDIHTAIPAKVTSYDASKQTIECVPALNRSLPDGQGNYTTEQLPKLVDVPVCFPRCGSFFLSFPIQAGDFVLLVICQRNIGNWRATGNQGDPGDLGMHTLDGAVAIPGVFPDSGKLSNADGTNMVLGSDSSANGRIELKAAGVNLGAGATDGVATLTDLKALAFAIGSAATAIDNSGATFKANIVANLISEGWSAATGDGKQGSSVIKANR
jgi:hypothetical protein